MVAFTFAFAFTFTSPAHAEVDWSRGLVTAEGIGIADRHAPTPAVAREPARRMAEEAARKALAAQLPALPLAQGGTLQDRLTPGSPAVDAIAKVVARAITIAATPQTDGSWTVTLAVPLEAVRLALGTPRAQLPGGDTDPPVVIVEGVTAAPALGYAVGQSAGAVVWRKDVPAWAKDAPRVKATSVKPGLIELPDGKPRPTTNGGPSTLYIVIRRA